MEFGPMERGGGGEQHPDFSEVTALFFDASLLSLAFAFEGKLAWAWSSGCSIFPLGNLKPLFLDESGAADFSMLWVICITFLSTAFGIVVSILRVLTFQHDMSVCVHWA